MKTRDALRMEAVDSHGTLYSQGGLRFGGYRTERFDEITKPLEAMRPGARDEIITEAHYQVIWLHAFSEIGFLAGVFFWDSVVHGLVLMIGCYLVEYFRLLGVGVSPALSTAAVLWVYVRWLLLAAMIVAVWSQGLIFVSTLVGLAIIQFWWMTISSVLGFPFRIIMQVWSRRHLPHLFNAGNHEAWVLQLTIQRWRSKLRR